VICLRRILVALPLAGSQSADGLAVTVRWRSRTSRRVPGADIEWLRQVRIAPGEPATGERRCGPFAGGPDVTKV